MKNTLRMAYTVCYDTKCMHNNHNRCLRAIPIGECRRRERFEIKRLERWEQQEEKHGR